MARKDYFTHFEPSQSQGGAKTGEPREKLPDHPKAELGLSHMWTERGSNPHRWEDERFRTEKISGLNHSTPETIAYYVEYQNLPTEKKKCLLGK